MSANLLLLNYGAGNMASIRNALCFLNIAYDEIDSGIELCPEGAIILLPGVGSFAQASYQLKRRGLTKLIQSCPRIIGICLGMQLLFSDGDEGGDAPGLGLLDGHVRPISNHPSYSNRERIPHVGWQKLTWEADSDLYNFSIKHDQDFYFVHSFMAYPAFPGTVLATAQYGDVPIPAVVADKHVVGFQFHPEKSGPAGLYLLGRTIAWLRDQP